VTKRLLMMLSLLFAVGLIAAGCGGDDDETTATTTTETTEETTDTGPTGAAGIPETPEEATEACIAQLDAFPAEISDDVRAEIEELCQNTDEVSVEEGQQIAEDVCTLLVEDALPEGPQRDTAVETCQSAGEGLSPSS
jgi:hypothetical protein